MPNGGFIASTIEPRDRATPPTVASRPKVVQRPPPDNRRFQLANQTGRLWCWAAVASSVASFYGRATTQCDLAAQHHRTQLNPPTIHHTCCDERGRAKTGRSRCDHTEFLSAAFRSARVVPNQETVPTDRPALEKLKKRILW